MIRVLSEASIVALASMFMGVVPLAMGIVYVIWPTEQRLTLMRPLSLATIFAAISGSVLVWSTSWCLVARSRRHRGSRDRPGMASPRRWFPSSSASGVWTVAWLCVAVGLWRRP